MAASVPGSLSLARPLDDVRDVTSREEDSVYEWHGVYARQEMEQARREQFQDSLLHQAFKNMTYVLISTEFLKIYPSAAGYPLDPCNREGEMQKICQDSKAILWLIFVPAIAAVAYPILGLIALSTKENYYKTARAIKTISGLALVGAAVESTRQNFLFTAATTLFCAATILSRKFEKKTIDRVLESKIVKKSAINLARVGMAVKNAAYNCLSRFCT